MEDKLRNLDKVMDRAVYQKKRFSEARKLEVMKRIREEEQSPPFLAKYFRFMKPVLSMTVCLFLFFFSVTYILEPTEEAVEPTEGLLTVPGEHEVTSLPLLNRISNIAQKENEFIEYVSVSKRDRYVWMRVDVVDHSEKKEVQETIEQMFYKGTELYTGQENVREIGPPWDDYTVDIQVVKKYEHAALWQENETSAFLIGVKQTNGKKITWINGEGSDR